MFMRSYFFVLVLSAAFDIAQAGRKQSSRATSGPPKPKRGVAMLQGFNGTSVTSGVEQPMDDAVVGPFVVQLERVQLRSLEGHSGGQERSMYIGNITVGYPPQRLRVLFDTSSGNVLIPHRVCRSKACVEHQRYSSQKSLTSEDVEFNGTRVQKQHRLAVGRVTRDSVVVEWTAADLGTGNSKAVLVRDKVCVKGTNGRMACAWPSANVALNMDDVPFRAMPSDGILGLGLEALAASPSCSFFGSLVSKNPSLTPMFGLSFDSTGGELHIGGHDKRALASPLQWFPVHSAEEGYWQVLIQSVRLGNKTVDACKKGCHAIMDTSAARLGVQKSRLPALRENLMSEMVRRELVGGVMSCQGPELEFDLGGMSIKIGPEDYSTSACEPELGSLDLDEPVFTGVYTFGESVLRHYFVAFNWQDRMMGFAPSKASHQHGATSTYVEQILL